MDKLLKKIGVMAISGMLLTGCAGQNNGVEEKTKKTEAVKVEDTTITVWHQYEPKVEEALQVSFDKFSQENEGIKVEFIKQNELANKVTLTGHSPDDAPDIICGPNDWSGRFSTMGIIKPITEYVNEDKLKDHLESTKEAVTYQDNIYGVPVTYECLVMMYNKDLLEKAPENTDEILKLMAEKTNEEQWGFIGNVSDAYHMIPWIYGNGGYPINDQSVPGLDQKGMIETLKFVGAMKPYLPKNVDYGVMDGLFKEGNVAAIINGSWAISEYKEVLGDKLGVATIPTVSKTGKPGQPFLGVQAAFVSATTEGGQAIGKVLNHFASQEVGQIFADNGYLASNQTVDQGEGEIIEALRAQAKNAIPMPTVPEMAQCWEPISNALKEVIVSDAPDYESIAKAAQKDATERIESIK